MFDNLLKRWHRSDAHRDAAVDLQRWVVLDTETTGLNIRQDQVISVAAVAIHIETDLSQPRISLADTFEAVIRQDKPRAQKDNILIHHIGVAAQAGGGEQAEILAAFANWVGDSPLFAYHADFDRAMLAKAFKSCAMHDVSNPWVDVQPLANWVTRQIHPLGLDECATRFNLESIVRHQAASDTFVTAELLLCLLPNIRQVAKNFVELQRLAIDNDRHRGY